MSVPFAVEEERFTHMYFPGIQHAGALSKVSRIGACLPTLNNTHEEACRNSHAPETVRKAAVTNAR
jgi:hypothetical protein